MSHFVTTQKREDISEWFRTICKVTVGDAISDVPGVLAMDRNTPVSEVLSTLEELEIQSVAISAPPNSYIGAGGVNVVSQGQQIIGIVSIIDVLAFSLKNSDYLTRAVSEVIGSTNESLTLWCEESKKPLYFAMEQFIKGVHHSLVQNTDDPSVPLKYLAQTDIVRFLIHNPDAFPALEAILVQPVEVVTTCFVTPAYLSTPLVEAISLLVEHGAVPVVNEDGIVVSNLSASDFKGKSTTDLRATPGATVMDLLRHQANDLMDIHAPLTVSRNSSLRDAATHMLVNHVHRLWVVPPPPEGSNDAGSVFFEGLGVLTLTDILRAIYISEST